MLYRDCQVPPLIRAIKYFDLRKNPLEGFREIRTHLLGQSQPLSARFNHLPVPPPPFIGRESEVTQLRDSLQQPPAVVLITSMPGCGKTTLALQFAHRHQQDFEAVDWLHCVSGNLASISAELARLLGLKLEGDTPQIVAELKNILAAKRCLLVLDNVEVESPGDLIPGGRASVLITTRRSDLKFLRHRKPVELPLFRTEECLQFFRDQLGNEQVAKHEADCERLFTRLGHLPIAVSVAAALIHHYPKHAISTFIRSLPNEVKALIREAIDALDEVPRRLLTAMSACAPEGFAIDLAAEIAGIDEYASLEPSGTF